MPEIKVCGKCGAKNPVSNNFCEQCGSKLPAAAQSDKPAHKPAPPPKASKQVPETESREKAVPVQALAPAQSGFPLSWMQVGYILLLMLAVFTRFDHLGAKPHHHDESMHAFYSYQLYQDGDYEYNPMMHGPFQFHGNAFMYYLFGVSNATSRFLAANFGMLTVILAIFLAPFIGRWGAFLATAMIVASPSFMYFDRFTREDAYICGATFLMVVFLFRYYRSRKPLDLWWAALGFTIAFCTKESMFLTIAVLGTYLFIRLLPWADVFISGGLTAFAILTQLIIPKGSSMRMPVFLLLLGAAFLYTMFQLYLRWRENLKKGPESGLWDVICGMEFEKIKWELAAFVGWWVVAMVAFENPWFNLNHGTFFSLLLLLAYFAVIFRFCWLWLTNVAPALTGSFSIFLIIFTLLFTTFFTVGASQPDFFSRIQGLLNDGTDRGGVYNGILGGLKYWWHQQPVHRGDEPWYYYLIQLPANETVSFLFSLVAMAYYGLFKRRTIPLFLAYWYVGTLALLSWAGEKMPWLIIHPLLPALLLSAYFMGQIIESRHTEQFWRAARASAVVLFVMLMSYSVHSAVLLSFYHEDNPVEPLVYVQSGPDCLKVVKWVRKISYGETGGTDLPMTIEDKCSWPFAWMLRDFHKRNHPSQITSADNPIIMSATESDPQVYPLLSKAGYVNRKYKMRVWWVPSWFKKGYPPSEMNASLFFNWLFHNFLPFGTPRPDMVDWNDLKNWILYRKVWSDLGSYNMRLWVRKDLAERYGFTQTDRSDIPTEYPTPAPTPAPTPVAPQRHARHRSAVTAATVR